MPYDVNIFQLLYDQSNHVRGQNMRHLNNIKAYLNQYQVLDINCQIAIKTLKNQYHN